MRGQVNTRIGSQTVLKGSERGYPPDVMHLNPNFTTAFSLILLQVIHPDNLDCCHPYWQTHRRDHRRVYNRRSLILAAQA